MDPLAESFPGEGPYIYVGNNPITYFDVAGKFRLDPNIIRDYPHFASYIQNNVIDHTNSEHLMSAFLQHTNLSRDQIIKDFSWGEGPLIITGTRTLGPTGPVFGQYDRNENGDPTIFLEESLIKRFEESMKNERLNDDTRQALLLGISGTLFHEYGHHGGTKDNDGTARALDNAIWGTSPPNNLDVHGLRTSLHKFRDGIRISPNNLDEIIETVPDKKDINLVPRLPKLD